VAIYDLRGRRVAVVKDSRVEAGAHTETWNGRALSGERVAAGIYLVRLEARGQVDTRRLVVIR
jgi:flagellar hook assembly protein FlgD